MQDSNTDVLENVTLPCLKILANSIQKATKASEEKVTLALFAVCSSTIVGQIDKYSSKYSCRRASG